MTARARLTLTYSALLTLTAFIILVILNVFMRYVPTYTLADSVAVPDSTGMLSADPVTISPETTAANPSTVLTIATETDVVNTLTVTSIVTLVILAAVGALVSWFVAGRVLRPLRRISDAVELASSGSLDHRIALGGPPDEITRLAFAFDAMLERLDRSFQTQERFVANAAHELRTPLATSKTVIDVALADPHHRDLRPDVVRLRVATQRSIETVEALLDLSALAATPLQCSQVDLGALLDEVIAEVAAEANSAGVAVRSSPVDQLVLVNRPLIRQMISNLLLNAIRYNTAGGWVTVSVSGAIGHDLLMTIENTGVPLDPESVPLLTEPFYRGAGRISRQGSGLGLALVDAIVGAHLGRLTLHARAEGGLLAEVVLPR